MDCHAPARREKKGPDRGFLDVVKEDMQLDGVPGIRCRRQGKVETQDKSFTMVIFHL